MQRNSTAYIVGFCVAVCLVCSVLVSSAAVGLREKQEENQLLDRQKKVLAVSGLIPEGVEATAAEVRDMYDKRVRPVVVDLEEAQVDESIDPSTFDQQKAMKDPAASAAAPRNPAGVQRVPDHAIVFYISKNDMGPNGEGFELDQYIFPVEGKGLWSTLYGYLALAPDGNEIRGLTFYQHAETPGLGGEVDNPIWKAKWLGRLAYGPEGMKPAAFAQPQISVIKGQAGSPEKDPHSVDGLSGATITSKGVSNLLQFWLGEEGFGPFIKQVASRAEAS